MSQERDLDTIKTEYEGKYNSRCSVELAAELLEAANDDVALVLAKINRANQSHRLKGWIEEDATKAKQKKERAQKIKGNLLLSFERKYQPALEAGVIDDYEYNLLLHDYGNHDSDTGKQLQYRVQLWWANEMNMRHPEVAAVQGIDLNYWEGYAFRMMAVEQKQQLDLPLIRQEAQRYRQQWVDSEAFAKFQRKEVTVKQTLLGEM